MKKISSSLCFLFIAIGLMQAQTKLPYAAKPTQNNGGEINMNDVQRSRQEQHERNERREQQLHDAQIGNETQEQEKKAAANAGYKNSGGEQHADAHDPHFDNFKIYFVDELWKIYPGWATSQGFHKYDDVLVIPDAAERDKQLKFCDRITDSLKQFHAEVLDANDRTDYRLIENFTNGVRFNINEFKSFQWNPSVYNIGGDIFDVLDYKQTPLKERLLALSKKLALVPQYYKAAEKNIERPTKEHTQLAIDQNKGSLYFFDKALPDSLSNAKLSKAEQTAFKANAAAARAAVEEYISYLKNLLPSTEGKDGRSFRIGKDLYEKKFAIDINSQYSAEEMYKKAEARKNLVQDEMYSIAQKLWSKYLPTTKMPGTKLEVVKAMIDTLSVKHCKRDDFLSTIEKQLPELTAFINQHQLIDLDSTKPLKVRKTPEYMAGVAGASISSPGPYDKQGTTYYNVTPLTHYSDAEAESYLREYNDYVLPILNIHEAIPGHYTQGIYANRSPSIIKAILGNGATVEGWACYVERMMIEEGFHDSPEMLLFYYKWNLREACNFILDYNIHCGNWSEKEVRNLLVDEAFQQETEAKEKYKRATLSQVQLTSYFTGLTEIYELREEMKTKFAKRYSLKRFNEKFLSFGSAPVKEISAILLRK